MQISQSHNLLIESWLSYPEIADLPFQFIRKNDLPEKFVREEKLFNLLHSL